MNALCTLSVSVRTVFCSWSSATPRASCATSIRRSRLPPRSSSTSPRTMPSLGLMLLLKMVASGSIDARRQHRVGPQRRRQHARIGDRQVVALRRPARGCDRSPRRPPDRSSAAPRVCADGACRRDAAASRAPPRALELETWIVPSQAGPKGPAAPAAGASALAGVRRSADIVRRPGLLEPAARRERGGSGAREERRDGRSAGRGAERGDGLADRRRRARAAMRRRPSRSSF